MRLSFYIAGRYLVSKKTHNVINVISLISALAIMVGTASLVIIMSVFNGFEALVHSLLHAFNPDVLVLPYEGKVFNHEEFDLDEVAKIPGVASYSAFIEENALVRYRNEQYIVKVKGLTDNYLSSGPLDSMMVAGGISLSADGMDYAVLGYLVAYQLGVNLNDVFTPLQFYVPDRKKKQFSALDPEGAFNTAQILPGGVFSVQQEYDSEYILVPIEFAGKLFGYPSEISGVEIRLTEESDVKAVIEKIRSFAGEQFVVKDRLQQDENLYRIMKSEKWAIFFILSFILVIATFNLIGSVSMLILDKRRDISVLFSLGASETMIRDIFLSLGLMVTLAGVAAGLVIGAGLCFVQEQFGLLRLGADVNAFIITYYPVKMKFMDFLLIAITVFVIGTVCAWLPVRRITWQFLRLRIHDYLKIQ